MAFPVAFWCAIAGGSVILLETLVALPLAVSGLGWLAFLLSVVLAPILGFRAARRRGTTLLRSLGAGLRQLGRWIWEFMP